MIMDKLLTAKEAANKLSVSLSAIYKWVDEHRLPYVDIGEGGRKRCFRFREQDLEKEVLKKSKN